MNYSIGFIISDDAYHTPSYFLTIPAVECEPVIGEILAVYRIDLFTLYEGIIPQFGIFTRCNQMMGEDPGAVFYSVPQSGIDGCHRDADYCIVIVV